MLVHGHFDRCLSAGRIFAVLELRRDMGSAVTIIALSLATLIAYQAVQFIYVMAQLLIGRLLGASPKRVSLGFGPTIFRQTFRSVQYRLAIVPLGGYTEFVMEDDLKADNAGDRPTPLESLPFASRALVTLVGPLTNLTIGLVLLAAATYMPRGKVVVDETAPFRIHPSGVPNLRLANEPATVESQEKLFNGTFVTFSIKLFTFQSLKGWSGTIGWLATCAAAGAASPGAWLTCFGIACLCSASSICFRFRLPTAAVYSCLRSNNSPAAQINNSSSGRTWLAC